MSCSPEFTGKIDRGVAFLESLLKEEGVIYGVTNRLRRFMYCGYSDGSRRGATLKFNPVSWLWFR